MKVCTNPLCGDALNRHALQEDGTLVCDCGRCVLSTEVVVDRYGEYVLQPVDQFHERRPGVHDHVLEEFF